jgi:hypothetical protein
MASVVAPPAFHSSGHSFAPHHNNGFAAFNHQQLTHYRVPTAVHHNPFGAFGPRHHSGAKSPSAAASWRHSESADRTPIATRTAPKYRRGGPSHSRTPSTSSEASTGSWRERSRSPAVATVELQPKPKEPTKASEALIYTVADLLRLSASPLVGISAESQAVVDDLVAHHVWRRGPQLGTPKAGRRHRNRGTSRQGSSSGSSTSSTVDDSERSD